MARIDTDKMQGQKLQGCACASQAALDFQIPPQASLHGIIKTHRSFCSAKYPCIWFLIMFFKMGFENTTGCAWPAKRGDVVKKHPQARLRGSFNKQIQHSRSESTLCFLSSDP